MNSIAPGEQPRPEQSALMPLLAFLIGGSDESVH